MAQYEWYAADNYAGSTSKAWLCYSACDNVSFAVQTPFPEGLKEWLEAMGIDTTQAQPSDGWFVICGAFPTLNDPPDTHDENSR